MGVAVGSVNGCYVSGFVDPDIPDVAEVLGGGSDSKSAQATKSCLAVLWFKEHGMKSLVSGVRRA